MSLAPPTSRLKCPQAWTKSQTGTKRWLGAGCLGLLAGIALLPAGCGVMSNLIHASGADMVPAKYEGLEDSTVAIVTVTDSSQYSDDIVARELNSRLAEILTQKVDDVRLVRADKIRQWRDVNGWDAIDFQAIGEGVKADKVVGIEVSGMKLREGPTLFRGTSDVVIKVIDVDTGTVDFVDQLDEYIYPTMAGQSATETSESRFRKLYLSMLAQEIGRSFHPYDSIDRIALDSFIAGQ